MGKQYLYQCKMQSQLPLFKNFTAIIENTRHIEEMIAKNGNNIDVYKEKWSEYTTM